MSAEAESPKPEETPLDAFDVLPDADRREALLKQWTDGFAEDKSIIIIARSTPENPLGFHLSEAFPELTGRTGKLHRRWADCQLASDSVRWSSQFGRHLVCLIPAGGRWFAGLENSVNTVVVGDGFRHPIDCLEELRVNLVILVGIYAGRVLEARRNRPQAQEEPGAEPEGSEPESQKAEATEQPIEEARDPPQ